MFWCSYELSDVQKFTYLIRYLVVVAQKVKLGVMLTETIYREVRENLWK